MGGSPNTSAGSASSSKTSSIMPGGIIYSSSLETSVSLVLYFFKLPVLSSVVFPYYILVSVFFFAIFSSSLFLAFYFSFSAIFAFIIAIFCLSSLSLSICEGGMTGFGIYLYQTRCLLYLNILSYLDGIFFLTNFFIFLLHICCFLNYYFKY